MLGHLGDLTRGRLLARNVVANLVGWALPAAVALAAIPALVHALGPARFGVLALAWSLVGYFSLFDVGIGRALTQLLASRAGTVAEAESPALTWAGLWVLAGVGTVGALLVAGGAQALATRWLNVPPELRDETYRAFRLLAIAVPAMVITSGLRAVLEAAQQFRAINALRVPLAVVNFAGPLLALPVTHDLAAAVGVLVAGRVATCIAHAVVIWRRFPTLRQPIAPTRASLRALVGIAGWMTVSGVVSPLMTSVDRVVIGLVLPVAAVGYYSSASEVATKLWLFTAALQPVLFPALAATIARDPAHATRLFDRAVRVTTIALLPGAALMMLFAREGLTLWIGAAFATQASAVLRGLVVAVFVNGVGQVAYAVLQAGGRSDVTGRLHVVELPLYAGLLALLLSRFGLVGVAAAWAARMMIDTVVQLWLAGRHFPALRDAARRAQLTVAGGVACLGLAAAPSSTRGRALFAVALALVFTHVAWTRLVTADERRALRSSVAARGILRRLRGLTLGA